MFIRPAINGQPLFNDYVQTFALSDMPIHSVATKILSHLAAAILKVSGTELYVEEDDIEISVTPDFVTDNEEIQYVPQSVPVYENATIAGVYIESGQPALIMLSMNDTAIPSRMYHLLLELDHGMAPAPDPSKRAFIDETLRWKLNDTIVVTFDGTPYDFIAKSKEGEIDPELPGWTHLEGTFFSELPLTTRLGFFAPQPVGT